MNKVIANKLEEILASKENGVRIQTSASLEEAYAALTAEGLDVTYEEFAQEYEKAMHEMIASDEGELDVDMLDSVGGGLWRGALIIWYQMR